MKNKTLFISFFILLAAILACANPIRGNAPSQPQNVETVVAATLTALTPASSDSGAPLQPLTGTILPHSMYFLNTDSAGLTQVFRLETDGVTVRQITFEPAKVDSYDVSRIDGRVAYVSNNQLLLINADGSGRTLLFDGGVQDEVNPFVNAVRFPAWSPNGQTIAYGYKGLNFYSLATGQTNLLIPDSIEDQGNGFIFPREMIWPDKFSADGSKLLVTLGYYEGASAAIYYLNGNALVRLNGAEGSIICCGETQWTPDGSAIYSASPTFGMFKAGLWRVDAATGNVTTLFSGHFDSTVIELADEPFASPDGSLYYFYGSVPGGTDMVNRASLQLVRSGADGITGREVLRPEAYDKLNEALWSPDGSFVIAALAPIADVYYGGEATLIYTDGQKSVVKLVPFAIDLRWGP